MAVRQVHLPERERVGYEVNYAVQRSAKAAEITPFWRRIKTEERLGSLTFWGGAIWAIQIATKDITRLVHVLLTPGPIEVCGVGLLIWLHAKWRRSVRIV